MPYDKIVEMFEEGYLKPSNESLMTYDSIMVGVAPGGYISVWANGIEIRKIGSFQAEEIEGDFTRILEATARFTREEYVDLVLKEDLDEEVYKSLKSRKIPFGLWEKYEEKYNYQFEYFTEGEVLKVSTAFYNGEYIKINCNSQHPLNLKKISTVEKPIPKMIKISFKSKGGYHYVRDCIFSESEIFKAFGYLTNEDKNTKLHFRFEISSIDRSIKVFLRNDKEIVELKETVVER